LALALAALAASAFLTGVVRRLALAVGFVDQPGGRKTHAAPTALGGGVVIFWVTAAPLALAALAGVAWQEQAPAWVGATVAEHLPGLARRAGALGILLGAAGILHVMRLIDDRHRLGPKVKLAVQFGVAFLIAGPGGMRFTFFIPSELLATALTVLWIVVIINAFNFLDNMDGLSAGVAAICGAILLSAAAGSVQKLVSALVALFLGALLGFLIFNFAPARIFMGDAGSLVVGLFIAVATIQTTYYQQAQPSSRFFSAFMPLVALAVPLYDFVSVTLIRLAQGASPFVGDQQHFSHRLVRRGMSTRQAVLTIYLATAGTGLGATFLNDLPAFGAVLVLLQALLIVLIIAILEQPVRTTLLTSEPGGNQPASGACPARPHHDTDEPESSSLP